MMYSLGIMSGTSLDGLDISLIKSDGEKKIFPIYNITYSYSQEFKNEINLDLYNLTFIKDFRNIHCFFSINNVTYKIRKYSIIFLIHSWSINVKRSYYISM